MRRTTMLLSAGILVLCLAATSAAQADQRSIHRQNSFAEISSKPGGVLIAMAGNTVGNRADNQHIDNSGQNDKDAWGDAEYYEKHEPRNASHDRRINSEENNEKDKWGDAEYYEEFEPGGNADDKRIDSDEEQEKDKWGDAEYYEG